MPDYTMAHTGTVVDAAVTDVNALVGAGLAKDLVLGAANGLDLSANVGAAGMTSELLDWYEEGEWTPELWDDSLSNAEGQTYDANVYGIYTRIGRMYMYVASYI